MILENFEAELSWEEKKCWREVGLIFLKKLAKHDYFCQKYHG